MPQETSFKSDSVPYTVCRSERRRRTLALRVEQDGGLRILAPEGLSLKKIESFLQRHMGWIRRKRKLRRPQRSVVPGEELGDGSLAPYRGESCLLKITQTPERRSSCVYANGVLEVAVSGRDLSSALLGEEARLELRLWYKKQARREFQERAGYWSARLGVSFGRLIVTSPARRWGSCNARNDIRLNWRLILAPPPLLDYVVAHELCHVLHKNHARAFWGALGEVMPDYKQRRRQLRAWEASAR
ncbi:MAG: SprT family zinc-dependent metalloprotease [Alphaproteobacteria bacterium]|nr:SprT family zinc-dependent metalloprotease [Alphaproteobacteria bacterium]